jgi:hypothetical protein
MILLASLATFFAASVQAQDAPPPPPPPPPAPNVPISEWRTFKSEDGKFSVLLPTTPKEDHQTNGQVKTHVFRSFISQHDFKLTYVELPNPAPDVKTLWEKTRDGAGAPKGMKLVGEKMIEVNGHPVLELAAEGDWAFLQIRFLTVGNRIYQLMVFSSNKKAETPEARAFLDSFKFLTATEEKKPKQDN